MTTETTYRRCGGKDRRGSNRDRRQRKHWLLNTFGNGVVAPCTFCDKDLDYNSIEADRIIPGGSYRHENIQPACRQCNRQKWDNADWQLEAA